MTRVFPAYCSQPSAWYCTRIWLFNWLTSTGTAAMSAGNSNSDRAMAGVRYRSPGGNASDRASGSGDAST